MEPPGNILGLPVCVLGPFGAPGSVLEPPRERSGAACARSGAARVRSGAPKRVNSNVFGSPAS